MRARLRSRRNVSIKFLERIIMKYRIKETIYGNDVSIFTVQYKLLWWWENCVQRLSKQDAETYIKSLQTKKVKYHTIEHLKA